MEEVKDKMKGLIKKVNHPFSSSSPKFKGPGRVLGSGPSPSPSASAPTNPIQRRSPPPPPPPPSRPIADSPSSGALFDCPVCAHSFPTPDDVAAHLDLCLAAPVAPAADPVVTARVAAYLAGKPAQGSVEVVLKLLTNVVREPGSEKFRRIRMGNPRISEAVGAAEGGVELLECLGFKLADEGGEMWATMEAPSERQIALIKEAVSLLERRTSEESNSGSSMRDNSSLVVVNASEPKKIDRKVKVFFPVSESVAADIDLPDSFFNLSNEEIRKEAAHRRQKLEESKLLVPKSFREKQTLAARKKYKATVLRIQFPDGVVLQGVFLPWETTTKLYEFVSSALKDPSLEFELLLPAMPKLRVIPRFARAGERMLTLEDVELVPSALLRFKPIETERAVFTGLSNELLEASEPLARMTAV